MYVCKRKPSDPWDNDEDSAERGSGRLFQNGMKLEVSVYFVLCREERRKNERNRMPVILAEKENQKGWCEKKCIVLSYTEYDSTQSTENDSRVQSTIVHRDVLLSSLIFLSVSFSLISS